MIDEAPTEQQAIWDQLRAIDAPPGAQQRVQRRIEEELVRPRTKRLAYAVAVPVVAAAVVALVLATRTTEDARWPRVLAASDARQGERALSPDMRLGSGAVYVGGRLRVELDRAAVEVIGPASVELAPTRVVLRAGQLEIDGDVDVAGPTCNAKLSGKGKVTLHETRMMVTVFAGSAEITPPEVTCEVIDLTPVKTARAAPTPAPATAAGGVPASEATATDAVAPPAETPAIRVAPRVPTPAADPPSVLAQQTEAYWEAMRTRKAGDPSAALDKLREIARRWPRAPIRHEVDLAILDTLVELGRVDEARAAARRFLREHPRSERAADVRQIAGLE